MEPLPPPPFLGLLCFGGECDTGKLRAPAIWRMLNALCLPPSPCGPVSVNECGKRKRPGRGGGIWELKTRVGSEVEEKRIKKTGGFGVRVEPVEKVPVQRLWERPSER